jgi:hypothetical protein
VPGLLTAYPAQFVLVVAQLAAREAAGAARASITTTARRALRRAGTRSGCTLQPRTA